MYTPATSAVKVGLTAVVLLSVAELPAGYSQREEASGKPAKPTVHRESSEFYLGDRARENTNPPLGGHPLY
jgi:hypothetical protein